MEETMTVGSNILKRAIEHMSAGPFDSAREEAIDILNGAIEECFYLESLPVVDSEWKARRCLWNAAQYLYRHQFGSYPRVEAMDILDDIRRDYANWHDLAELHGVEYRNYPVFRHKGVK
jgi:hypothetical protein